MWVYVQSDGRCTPVLEQSTATQCDFSRGASRGEYTGCQVRYARKGIAMASAAENKTAIDRPSTELRATGMRSSGIPIPSPAWTGAGDVAVARSRVEGRGMEEVGDESGGSPRQGGCQPCQLFTFSGSDEPTGQSHRGSPLARSMEIRVQGRRKVLLKYRLPRWERFNVVKGITSPGRGLHRANLNIATGSGQPRLAKSPRPVMPKMGRFRARLSGCGASLVRA